MLRYVAIQRYFLSVRVSLQLSKWNNLFDAHRLLHMDEFDGLIMQAMLNLASIVDKVIVGFLALAAYQACPASHVSQLREPSCMHTTC